jgi:CheY-like chemotaxis protein
VKETAKNLILLVEDDQSIRKDLCSLLELEGYEVYAAEHGQAAVTILESTTKIPALIILDIMMPIMDGWKFREAQLLMHDASAIPVVVMTADGHAAEKATKMNAQGFIQKPIQSIESFLETVNRFSSVS